MKLPFTKKVIKPRTYGASLIGENDKAVISDVIRHYRDSVTYSGDKGRYASLIVSLQHAVARNIDHPVINSLRQTDLLVEPVVPLVTFGADIEYLLIDKADQLVLFNSSMVSEWFHLSSSRIGGDMGLLEFRIEPDSNVKRFVGNIDKLYDQFIESYTKGDKIENPLTMLEKEAVNIALNQLILESQQRDPTLRYGSSKLNSFSRATGQVLLEGRTMYAYSDRPMDNDYSFTSCGGHLHFGGIVKSFNQSQVSHLVKLFDTYLAPIFLPIEDKDQARLRRRYYGLAGEYRIKQHGFEYRTPSNALFYPKNRNVLKEVLIKALWVIQNMHDLQPDKAAQERINNHG